MQVFIGFQTDYELYTDKYKATVLSVVVFDLFRWIIKKKVTRDITCNMRYRLYFLILLCSTYIFQCT